MTAADKIKNFVSLDNLMEEIKKDQQSHDILLCRYPVRFILLDNFNLFQKLIQEIYALNTKIFDLKKLLGDKDDWITKDELTNTIKNLQENYIISPVSEIVRFYEKNKFEAFSQEIALLENNNQLTRRIYIPLIGMDSKFNDFLNSFTRIAESAPVWSLSDGNAQPVTVYLTPSEDAYKGFSYGNRFQSLETMYDWLTFWKNQAPVEKIICSSYPINVNQKHVRPDNIFTIEKIDNAHEFITKYLKLSIPINYNETDKEYWHKLLSELDKSSNTFYLDIFVKNHFKLVDVSIKEIIQIWTSETSSEYDRWLLKNYAINYISDEYFHKIVTHVTDYLLTTNLLYHIVFDIFEKENPRNNINKRTNLIRLFSKNISLCLNDQIELKNKILNVATDNIEEAIALCTGKFDFEKELFVTWYSNKNITIQRIRELYPDFFNYIAEIEVNSWANSYIQEYKTAKINDEYSDALKLTISKKNASENDFWDWYYKFKTTKILLSTRKYDKLYWLDGVGIEWLSLIKSCIGNSTFQILSWEIATSEIPSSTEHNRFEEADKKENLDPNYIHNNIYQYPKTLCDEIEIVKQMMSDILNQSQKMTIAIVSDHGLTALSRLVEAQPYMTKASHEGRYIEVSSPESLEDKNYLRHKNGKSNYKVALTHASLNKKPVREVHGGCTPEEILVPFIVISNKKEHIQSISKNTVNQTTPKGTMPKQTTGFEEEDYFNKA